MEKRKKIENAAKDFYEAVIQGMVNRPAEFPHDKDMAKAAGVPPGTFCEYKNKTKGTQSPNFFYMYQIAYILAQGPPCSLEPESIMFNRYQEALKADKLKILDKFISLILAEIDLEVIAAGINIHYQRLFSPQNQNQNT